MVVKDKLIHAGVCAGISAFTIAMLRVLGASAMPACAGGFVAAMAAGVSKEYGDRGSTGFDWADIAADAVGATVGMAVGLL